MIFNKILIDFFSIHYKMPNKNQLQVLRAPGDILSDFSMQTFLKNFFYKKRKEIYLLLYKIKHIHILES